MRPHWTPDYSTEVTLSCQEGEIETVAHFEMEVEVYPAEPTSWGASRGQVVVATATFDSASIGNLTLTREMAVAIAGEAAIAYIEGAAAEAYEDLVRAGEAA